MAKVLMFSIVVFFILDFIYYCYLKRYKNENYKNYAEYIKKQFGK